MTHYEVLGVAEDASTEDIRRAYRRRARDHHPDANPTDAAAGERFRRVAEAYAVLSDPVRRSWYDAEVGVRPPAPEAPTPPAGASGPAAPPAPPPAGQAAPVADRILQVLFTLPLVLVPGLGVPARLVLLVGGWFAVGWLLRRHAAAPPVAFPWWRSPGWAGTGRLVRAGAVAVGLVVAFLVAAPLVDRVGDAVDAQGAVEDAAEGAAPPEVVGAARDRRDAAVDDARAARGGSRRPWWSPWPRGWGRPVCLRCSASGTGAGATGDGCCGRGFRVPPTTVAWRRPAPTVDRRVSAVRGRGPTRGEGRRRGRPRGRQGRPRIRWRVAGDHAPLCDQHRNPGGCTGAPNLRPRARDSRREAAARERVVTPSDAKRLPGDAASYQRGEPGHTLVIWCHPG